MNFTPFYFLRHGKTQANLDGLMCGGEWDIPLVAEGLEKIEAVGAHFAAMADGPTALFASPLIRTRETAAIISKQLKLPVTYVPELREWDLGEWDRRPFAEIKEKFLGDDNPTQGESREGFRNRVAKGVMTALAAGGRPLLVSHGGVALALQDLLKITRLRIENSTAFSFEKDARAIWTMRPLFLTPDP